MNTERMIMDRERNAYLQGIAECVVSIMYADNIFAWDAMKKLNVKDDDRPACLTGTRVDRPVTYLLISKP